MMLNVVSSVLMPYRPDPPPSAAGATCPSLNHSQNAAPLIAPPAWAFCAHWHRRSSCHRGMQGNGDRLSRLTMPSVHSASSGETL